MESQNAQESQKPKRMMTMEKVNGRYLVQINYSSLELLQTCLRKSHYKLNLGLSKQEESTALAFGKGIHKALEIWYQLPQSERVIPARLKDTAKLLGAGVYTDMGFKPEDIGHGSMRALYGFLDVAGKSIAQLPEDDKRSMASGIRILMAYFDKYHDDGFEVVSDKHGPLVERDFEFTLINEPTLQINYFGTIDLVLKNKETGQIVVCDHKTTHALGSEFYNRCKPNPQYTGYVLGARKALGLECSLFMINGIQVAKTKVEFAKQITERTEEDFQELSSSVEWQVCNWIKANELSLYPMTSPNPCSMYGGCEYRMICEAPSKIRGNIIESMFKQKGAQ